MDPESKPAGQTDSPAKEGQAESPKYMTAEEFNKAQSAREKRLLETFEKKLAATMAQFAPKRAEAEDSEEEPEDKQPEKPADKGAKGPQPSNPFEAELRQLRKALDREKAAREEEKKAREEQAAKLSREEERSKLSEALANNGVDPKKARAAIALLHTEDKRVRRNAEGRIVFIDADGDETDLSAGVKAWLATDDGRSFVSAREVGGSGERPGIKLSGGNPKDPKAANKAKLGAMLMGMVARP